MKKNIFLIGGLFLLGMASCVGGNDGGASFEAPGKVPSKAPSETPDRISLDIEGNDLGKVVIGSTKIAYLELRNTGTAGVKGLSLGALMAPFSIEGGVFPGKTGNCSAGPLAPGASCNIAIEVAKGLVEGVSSQQATFTYEASGKIFTKQVTLKAEFRDLVKLLTNNIDFGVVSLGNSKTLKLLLKNPSVHEDIDNISFQGIANSEFSILNPSKCKKLIPGSACELDVVFSPKAQANLAEKLVISYETQGNNRTEVINITAEGHDVEQYISVSSQSPLNQTVDYNGSGKIEVNLKASSVGPFNKEIIDQLEVEGAGLSAAGLQINKLASTCLPKTKLQGVAKNECKFVLETIAKIKSDVTVNKNINIKYRVVGSTKTHTLTLNNNFRIRKLELDQTSGHAFGKIDLVQGASALITIVVKNPTSSSMAQAANFKLASGLPPFFALDAGSTCLTQPSLAKSNTCTFIVHASPNGSMNNYSAALKIEYTVNGDVLTLPVTLVGTFNVTPAQQAGGAKGISFLDVGGADFGQIIDVTPHVPFDVTLVVTNNGKGGLATAASMDLKRYDPLGNNILSWALPFHVKPSPAKSTCSAPNLPLANGQTCKLVLEITPNPAFASDLGANGRKFRLDYTDDGGHVHEDDFALKGSWVYVGPPPLVAAGPAAPENIKPPPLIPAPPNDVSTKLGDPWYSYTKRPTKIPANMPPLADLYPQWVWDKIPAMVFTGVSFVAWTFKADIPNNPTRLMDIVPDRIVVDGITYIKLYHGSTSDALKNFTPGSSGIRFDAAQITALGDGFYLAGNPNESRSYACDRQQARRVQTGDKTIQAILLVVGVQEDPGIVGHESFNSLGYDKGAFIPLGKAIGDPIDDKIFFRRNQIMYNQFVFLSNVKPYLRIIEIVKLGKGFGMSPSYDDGDGFSTDNITPDANAAFKCD